MECKCETCVRENCQDRTKQDDIRIVTCCSDYIEHKQTNADRIRAMSDEELAEDYCKTLLKVMQYFGIKNTGILEDAVRARLEWLKQPAEE